MSKGHDKGVDIWALGVLIYEMIYGVSPFYTPGIDQVSLFKRIVQTKFGFPEGRGTAESTDLIQQLIVKKPINRMGCNATSELEILDHAFFGGGTINQLTAKQLVAPWKPEIAGSSDKSNFDDYSREERQERQLRVLSAAESATFDDF